MLINKLLNLILLTTSLDRYEDLLDTEERELVRMAGLVKVLMTIASATPPLV